jgi:hypothetical protein
MFMLQLISRNLKEFCDIFNLIVREYVRELLETTFEYGFSLEAQTVISAENFEISINITEKQVI